MNDETEVREPEIKVIKNEVREAAMLIPVESTGVAVQNFAQQVDYAKWMAQAGFAINKDLRGNVGACLAVLDMSQRWGFAPYQVARLCYQVNGVMALESQLIHAIIEKFAPLQQRLRCAYEGEGESRQCIVTGMINGETTPLVYTSPKKGDIKPQNSPLWKTDPDQQLWYYSSRSWCRKYCPDVLMGIFGRDEAMDNPHVGAENAIDVTASVAAGLHERLAKAGHNGDDAEGFRDGVVESGLKAEPEGPQEIQDAPKGKGRGKAKAAKKADPEPSQDTPKIGAEGAAEIEKGRNQDLSLPKNEKQYRAWVIEWLQNLDTEEQITERWDAERKLRNICGLTEESRKPIYDLVKERLGQINK